MKVVLFGATGMVGRAVLRECLRDDGVESVLSIGRTPCGERHPKLREHLQPDLFDVAPAGAALEGLDACFFCLGVSSAGMSEPEYTRVTYDLTLVWARALARANPRLTFVYVSGAGTGGRAMWARVKKRTEDALLALFPSAYMFRLAAVRALHGERPRKGWARAAYAVVGPVLPVVRAIAPGAVITSEELGRAMIRVARAGALSRVLEARDLSSLGTS